MPTCSRCGCSKPCACDGFTPDRQDTCARCGCTKPCRCDDYSRRGDDHADYGGVLGADGQVYSDADPGL